MKIKTGSKIRASLKISGYSCRANEISKIIGLKPTKTYEKGEKIKKTILKHKENIWMLQSPGDEIYDTLETHVAKLLEIVYPKADNFKKIPAGSEIALYCVIYAYEERPLIGFTADSIKKIAEIGAYLDVDAYDLCEYDENFGHTGQERKKE